MTSSEISQIKKLESVKYLDIASKNDLGTDLHVPLHFDEFQMSPTFVVNTGPTKYKNHLKLNFIRSILMKRK